MITVGMFGPSAITTSFASCRCMAGMEMEGDGSSHVQLVRSVLFLLYYHSRYLCTYANQ
jgi:hypothetical protein